MNKEHILIHLTEAQEELSRTIQDLKEDKEYDYGNYLVAMMHLYHHINTAWNIRDISRERANNYSEEDFNKWRQMPMDIPLD